MVIIVGIIFGGLILFNIIKQVMIQRFFKTFEPPAVAVSSVSAVQKNWHSPLYAVGNFIAINGVDVNAEAAGNVTQIHFQSGQYIEKDTPLIDIDDSVEQATLQFNQAALTLSQINYKRQLDLLKRGATATATVDESKANFEQAQANVEQIKAQIQQKHIRAPFTGQLGIRQINLGQYISPGQTAVVNLQSQDPLYLEFFLPEQLVNKISINQPITLQIEATPQLLYTGKISAMNAKIDTNSHNILVQAIVPNCPLLKKNKPPHKKFYEKVYKNTDDQLVLVCNTTLNQKHKVKQFTFIPGMFASITIKEPVTKKAIVLPSTAISYSLYGNSVFVIEKEKSTDNKAQERLRVKRVFVTLGEQAGNETVIKKGIHPNQLVVSIGELKLQNGAQVVINNAVKLKTTKASKLGE